MSMGSDNGFNPAIVFKALSSPNRLMIMKMLSKGEMCACEILEAFDFTQPTLSHHMKVLSEADLVVVNQVGKWAHYRVNYDTLAKLKETVSELGGAPHFATNAKKCC